MENIITGELLDRINLNYMRITCALYNYPEIFNHINGWPGDFVGRSILATASLINALKEDNNKQKVLLENFYNIFDHLDNVTNQYHYFGVPIKENDELINEQSLSGHSWYLRGLCEMYKITKDEKIFSYIKDVVSNLYLRISKDDVFNYPTHLRNEEAMVSGHTEKVKSINWECSSDVGCFFISFDGLSASYELLNDKNIKDLLDWYLEKFTSIDIEKIKFQTHATLSFTRGVLRMYHLTSDEKYLKVALSTYSLYVSCGMTKDYCNYNWFGKIDSWTEPCAIVDSLIISCELFKITKDEKYLSLYNKIYFNGIRSSQRSNGGAGCNKCLCDNNKELKNHLDEAWFCCSMRLSEGLSYLAQNLYYIENNNFYILLDQSFNFNDLIYADIDLYGKNSINIVNKSNMNIYLYLDKNISKKDSYLIKINEKDLMKKIVPEVFEKDGYYYFGDLLLRTSSTHSKDIYKFNNIKLYKPFDMRFIDIIDINKFKETI